MFSFKVSARDIIPESLDILISGAGGTYPCTFTFSPEWDLFGKIIAFKAGSAYEEVVYQPGRSISIPTEITALPCKDVYVACYGAIDGKVILSTEWQYIGSVQSGPVRPSTPGNDNLLFAQIISSIGDLGGLETEDKSNLVNAINETYSKIPDLSGLIPSVGNLDDLKTEDKSNLVNAINETYDRIPDKVSQLENDSAYVDEPTFDSTVGNIEILLSKL